MTRILVLLAALLTCGGCGLKGDLFLPEPTQQPEPASPVQQDTDEEGTDQKDADNHDKGVAHET